MFICTLSKKIRSKIAKIKKLVTPPVSTKRTNRVASKNHTFGRDKKFVLSNLISRGLRGKHTEKSDQNSEKNFSVLVGLMRPKRRMRAAHGRARMAKTHKPTCLQRITSLVLERTAFFIGSEVSQGAIGEYEFLNSFFFATVCKYTVSESREIKVLYSMDGTGQELVKN
jgi:hypothetical protein